MCHMLEIHLLPIVSLFLFIQRQKTTSLVLLLHFSSSRLHISSATCPFSEPVGRQTCSSPSTTVTLLTWRSCGQEPSDPPSSMLRSTTHCGSVIRRVSAIYLHFVSDFGSTADATSTLHCVSSSVALALLPGEGVRENQVPSWFSSSASSNTGPTPFSGWRCSCCEVVNSFCLHCSYLSVLSNASFYCKTLGLHVVFAVKSGMNLSSMLTNP